MPLILPGQAKTGRLLTPFEAPIAGQALTEAPGAMPYDRPPQFTDIEEATNRIFGNLVQVPVAVQVLGLMKAGAPISLIVETLLQSAVGEGMISFPMMYNMVPVMTVILIRMAQAAKIKYKLTQHDGAKDDIPELLINMKDRQISEDQAKKAAKAVEQSKGTLYEKGGMPRMGLMAPRGA